MIIKFQFFLYSFIVHTRDLKKDELIFFLFLKGLKKGYSRKEKLARFTQSVYTKLHYLLSLKNCRIKRKQALKLIIMIMMILAHKNTKNLSLVPILFLIR